VLYDLADGLRAVAVAVAPFLPTTAPRILEALGQPADHGPQQPRQPLGDQEGRDRRARPLGLLDVERERDKCRAGADVGERQRAPQRTELRPAAEQRDGAAQMITWTVPPSTDQAAPLT
jgi:hypothetical protein